MCSFSPISKAESSSEEKRPEPRRGAITRASSGAGDFAHDTFPFIRTRGGGNALRVMRLCPTGDAVSKNACRRAYPRRHAWTPFDVIEIGSKIAGRARRRRLARQNENGLSIAHDASRVLDRSASADFGCRQVSATSHCDESHRYWAKALQPGVFPGYRRRFATWRCDDSHRDDCHRCSAPLL